jgi:hypothetical protein
MSKRRWAAFPHPRDEFDYQGAALRKHWGRLHLGDREPFPSAEWVGQVFDGSPAAKKSAGKLGGDPGAAAERLQAAWRAFHRGDFQQAAEEGVKLGVVGYAVANKAAGIYANYLEKDPKARLGLLEAAAARAEEARQALPEHANSHYQLAYNLGRYGQGISVVKALAEGLGTRIGQALERTLALEPKHAEAHMASGTWHAEIVDKVGGLVGGLTYGASRDQALQHFRKALELEPRSAIARVEYAAGLLLLDRSKKAEAKKLLGEAAKAKPADAMESLDADAAARRLEEL